MAGVLTRRGNCEPRDRHAQKEDLKIGRTPSVPCKPRNT